MSLNDDFKPLQWLSEGWAALRDKAHNALTHFQEDGKPGAAAPAAESWGLVVSDVIDHADKVSVRMEVPGLSKEQIRVEVQANQLIVTGEKRSEATHREGSAVITERAFGHFRRVLSLPADVDADQATAEYRDGVLAIDLPKRGQTNRRAIEVG